MKKTGRKEGEKKQNGNTLRTRAGNRGGSVLRRGKKLVRARERNEHGLKEEILKIRKKTKREHEVSKSSTPGE